MFLVYGNDMTEGVSSNISLFANDAKLLRKIRNHMNGARHGEWNLMQKNAMYWEWEKLQ